MNVLPFWGHVQQIFTTAGSLAVLWEGRFGDGEAWDRVPEGDSLLRNGFPFLLSQSCWDTILRDHN